MILEAGELRWIWEVLGVRAWGGYDQSIIYKIVKELKKIKKHLSAFLYNKDQSLFQAGWTASQLFGTLY